MNRKIDIVKTALLSFLVCGTCLLSGCGAKTQPAAKSSAVSPAASSSSSSSQQQSKVSLTLADASGAAQAKVSDNIIGQFETYANLNIDYQSYPDGYRSYIKSVLGTDKCPDIYVATLNDAIEDYNAGYLYNFNDVIGRTNIYDSGKPWKDTLPKSMLERMYITENEIPGFPTTTNAARIYYNKDIFTNAGIKAPETWDEFISSCETLQKSGITPFAFPNSSDTDCAWAWFGNNIANQLTPDIIKTMDVSKNGFVEPAEVAKAYDSGTLSMTDESFATGYGLMREFSKYWEPNYNSVNYNQAIDMFSSGNAAMSIFTTNDYDKVNSKIKGAFALGVMPIPVITKKIYPKALGKPVLCGGQPDYIYCISKTAAEDSKKFKAAIDFLQYMTSSAVESELAKDIYRVPLAVDAKQPDGIDGFKITEEPERINYFSAISEDMRSKYYEGGKTFLSGGYTIEDFEKYMTTVYSSAIKASEDKNGWSKDNNYGLQPESAR